MKRRGFPPAHAAVPNLAPMIDVVMVILIFFMLGTSFAVTEGQLSAKLPSQIGPGSGSKVAMVPTVRIYLQADPGPRGFRILVMGTALTEGTFDSLAGMLAQKRRDGADANSPVQIGADPTVRYEHVIAAMDACTKAGFANLQVVVTSKGPATINQSS
ncbi:MAG: biopolymer transporter ExbD [Planctomycetes bacterium]|nr:biopolymer transporter ExbD [Planctomycetota bacterium]